MPDIQMCPRQDCPVARNCHRSPLSGTIPSLYHQAWSEPPRPWPDCDMYSPNMKKVYPTMREALFGALSILYRIAVNTNQKTQKTYEEGFEEGWHYAANSLTATIGDGAPNGRDTEAGELLVFFAGLDLDSLTEEGTWNDGFKHGITAVVTGAISILETVPADKRDAYIQWEHILSPHVSQVIN